VAAASEDFPPTLAAAYADYGLGWVVGNYRGQPMLSHTGGTFGFAASLAVWPEAELGIVVLTNAQGAELVGEAVQFRLAELLFDQPAEIEVLVAQQLNASAQRRDALRGRLSNQIDPTRVAPYLGRYANSVLGEVALTLQEGTLVLDVGEVRSRLRPQMDEQGRPIAHVAVDPPIASLPLTLREDARGAPDLVVPDPAGGNEYVFTAVSETPHLAASPSP
jgi:hypothetical protein